jgi:hypothetical protein
MVKVAENLKSHVAFSIAVIFIAIVVPVTIAIKGNPAFARAFAEESRGGPAGLREPPAEAADNAAYYYQKAIIQLYEVLKDERLKEVFRDLDQLIANGWPQEKAAAINDFLQAMEPAARLFKEGLKFEKCDFDFGRPTGEVQEYPPDMVTPRLNVAKIAILEACRLEKERKTDEALSLYTGIFRYSSQVSRGNSLIMFIEAMWIKKALYAPLTRIVKEPSFFDKEACQRFFNALGDLEDRERKFDFIADEERKFGALYVRQSPECVRAEYEKLAAGYFDYLKDVLLGEKGYLLSELERKTQESITVKSAVMHRVEALAEKKGLEGILSGLTAEAVEKDKTLCAEVAQVLFSIGCPRFKSRYEDYFIIMARFRLLRTAAALRIFRIETGSFPGGNNALIPRFFPKVPRDPFSTGAVRVSFKEGSAVIYSIGPDGKDEGGIPGYDEKTGAGDIAITLKE